jgi:hypothetical protein
LATPSTANDWPIRLNINLVTTGVPVAAVMLNHILWLVTSPFIAYLPIAAAALSLSSISVLPTRYACDALAFGQARDIFHSTI